MPAGESSVGCCQWWVRTRKRSRKGHSGVRTCDIVNGTGTPDLVVTKNQVSQSASPAGPSLLDQWVTRTSDRQPSPSNSLDSLEVNELFVSNVLYNAAATLEDNSTQTQVQNPDPIREQASVYADDIIREAMRVIVENEAKAQVTVSMNSSIVEDVAEADVRRSPTNVMADRHDSARRNSQTVSEYL